MTTKSEVRSAVIDAIEMVREASGLSGPKIAPTTDLLREVEGFDSLNALEVVVEVSESLGVHVPDEAIICGARDRETVRTLTVDDLVEQIMEHMEVQKDG